MDERDTEQQPQTDKEHRDEHLAAMGKSADEVPNINDPEEWRDAPKEGGGA